MDSSMGIIEDHRCDVPVDLSKTHIKMYKHPFDLCKYRWCDIIFLQRVVNYTTFAKSIKLIGYGYQSSITVTIILGQIYRVMTMLRAMRKIWTIVCNNMRQPDISPRVSLPGEAINDPRQRWQKCWNIWNRWVVSGWQWLVLIDYGFPIKIVNIS